MVISLEGGCAVCFTRIRDGNAASQLAMMPHPMVGSRHEDYFRSRHDGFHAGSSRGDASRKGLLVITSHPSIHVSVSFTRHPRDCTVSVLIYGTQTWPLSQRSVSEMPAILLEAFSWGFYTGQYDVISFLICAIGLISFL